MDLLEHSNIRRYQEKKKFHFAVVDQGQEESLLTSKAYSTKRGRDNGLRNLIKHLSRLEKKDGTESFTFQYKGRNNQLIATSPSFAVAQEREEAITTVRKVLSHLATPETQEEKSTDRSSKSTEPATGRTTLPPKYSFKLEFYHQDQNDKQALRGRIEYPFKKEKHAFEGIDLQAIERFLNQYLPKEQSNKSTPLPLPLKTAPKTSPIGGQVALLPSAVTTLVADASPDLAGISFKFVDLLTGQFKTSFQLTDLVGLGLQFAIDQSIDDNAFPEVIISLYGTALGTKDKQRLSSNNLATADFKRNGLVPVQFNASSVLQSGMYKFEVIVKLMASDPEKAPIYWLAAHPVITIT